MNQILSGHDIIAILPRGLHPYFRYSMFYRTFSFDPTPLVGFNNIMGKWATGFSAVRTNVEYCSRLYNAFLEKCYDVKDKDDFQFVDCFVPELAPTVILNIARTTKRDCKPLFFSYLRKNCLLPPVSNTGSRWKVLFNYLSIQPTEMNNYLVNDEINQTLSFFMLASKLHTPVIVCYVPKKYSSDSIWNIVKFLDKKAAEDYFMANNLGLPVSEIYDVKHVKFVFRSHSNESMVMI